MVLWKLLLKHKLQVKNSFRELLTLSNALNISDFYTMSVENIKKKVVASRRDYLTHKFSAHSHRKTHFQSTQQLNKLTNEKMKSRHKNCANAFVKRRAAAISKVEYT